MGDVTDKLIIFSRPSIRAIGFVFFSLTSLFSIYEMFLIDFAMKGFCVLMLSDLVYTTRHFRVYLLFILSSLFVTVASWPLTEILQEIVAHLGTLGIMKDKQVKSETVNTN